MTREWPPRRAVTRAAAVLLALAIGGTSALLGASDGVSFWIGLWPSSGPGMLARF